MNNSQIAHVMERIGLLLELKGENPFKIQAYNKASHTIAALPFSLEETGAQVKLRAIPGIGEALEKKILELLKTGELGYLKKLESEVPSVMFEMMRIPGLGPQKIRSLVETLGISSIGELEYAINENRIKLLKGFGEKTQNQIHKGIELIMSFGNQALFPDALSQAEGVVKDLHALGLEEVEIAGAVRRCMEIVKTIEIVVQAENSERKKTAELILEKLPAGDGKAEDEKVLAFRVAKGLPVNIHLADHDEFPTTLHAVTGSVDYVSALRSLAEKRGYTLQESGLFEKKRRIKLESEEELFKKLGMEYLPPELRENCGEIEAALGNRLLGLIRLEDIKGVFHVHTSWSDGSNTVEEMASAAKDFGLEYVGISDHSVSARYAGGLTGDRVKKQWEEIENFNARNGEIHVFKGIECDILTDGSLDYGDTLLEGFDFVIISVHSKLKMEKEEATGRIIRALSHPAVTMLGHPTGRLLLAREGYLLDMERILDACAEHGVAVELNADPNRLDIDWRYLRDASARGIPVSINPDAHSAFAISQIEHGIRIARKGWLRKEDVLNTLPLHSVERAIRKR